MIPLARRPATKVVVFQWPCGAASTRRSPLGPQPERRTMFVDAPVSSRNTKRSASMERCHTSDGGVGWHETHQNGRHAHQHEGCDQSRLAADAIAEMAEDRGAA